MSGLTQAARFNERHNPQVGRGAVAEEGGLPELAQRVISLDGAMANGRWQMADGELARLRVWIVFPYDPPLVGLLKFAVPGVRWDGRRKVWWVPAVIASLRPLALFAKEHGFLVKDEVRGLAKALVAKANQAAAASRALVPAGARNAELGILNGELEDGAARGRVEGNSAFSIQHSKLHPCLSPYQVAGVQYLMEHRRTICADEMGLGKTVEALVAVRELGAWPVVVVCPAGLVLNWKREAQIWVYPQIAQRDADSDRRKSAQSADQIEVVADGSHCLSGRAKVIVISYELLPKYVEYLRALEVRGVICDEAHYLKNEKTVRYGAVAALCKAVENFELGILNGELEGGAERGGGNSAFRIQNSALFLLTGTPIENRTSDLVALLKLAGRLEEFGGKKHFLERYCGAQLVPVWRKGSKRIGKWPTTALYTMGEVKSGDWIITKGKPWKVFKILSADCADGRRSEQGKGREYSVERAFCANGGRDGAKLEQTQDRRKSAESADRLLRCEGGVTIEAAMWAAGVSEQGGWHRIVLALDTSGSSNTGELGRMLRSRGCMLRRTKREVLTELPEKRRAVVTVGLSNLSEYQAAERDILAWVRGEALAEASANVELGMMNSEFGKDGKGAGADSLGRRRGAERPTSNVQRPTSTEGAEGQRSCGDKGVPKSEFGNEGAEGDGAARGRAAGADIQHSTFNIQNSPLLSWSEIAHLDCGAQMGAILRRVAAAEERAAKAPELRKVAALRLLCGRGKVAAAAEWIGDFLESGEALVGFALHREVLEALGEKFKVPILHGETTAKGRQRMVDDFQGGKLRLFLSQLQAGGVGITLTAASNVLMIEGGWKPSELDQGEDRLHRRGQRNAVTCWHLFAEGTIDWALSEIREEKRATAKEIVGDTGLRIPDTGKGGA